MFSPAEASNLGVLGKVVQLPDTVTSSTRHLGTTVPVDPCSWPSDLSLLIICGTLEVASAALPYRSAPPEPDSASFGLPGLTDHQFQHREADYGRARLLRDGHRHYRA